MITCKCGKTIDKVPVWMQAIQVEFVCNNCPNRQTKNIAFINLNAGLASAEASEEAVAVEQTSDKTAEA